MTAEKCFYRVDNNLDRAPLPDYLWHGYETRQDFKHALRNLVNLWHDRVGECVAEHHGFLLLRFHDTPGGKPDEEWLPRYLLQPTDPPIYRNQDDRSEIETVLDQAFGFD